MKLITQEQFTSFWTSVVLTNFPKVKIRVKSNSFWMRLLGKLLFFIPGFMTKMTTVLGNTIWVPYANWTNRHLASPTTALYVCAHEFVHMWDSKYNIKLFGLKYLFPQIWAILSLGALFSFYNLWYLLFLLALLFLLPWPSPWRTHIESNGYAMTMYIRKLTQKQYNDIVGAERLAENFLGMGYYYMCPNRNSVVRLLLNKYETLPKTHEAFKKVRTWAEKVFPDSP